MGSGCCRQLQGVLWKNVLLKRAAWLGTLFEILVPVGMMSLTVLLKDLSTQYDNPAVSRLLCLPPPFESSTSRPQLRSLAQPSPAHGAAARCAGRLHLRPGPAVRHLPADALAV